jgi:hypothetical protein
MKAVVGCLVFGFAGYGLVIFLRYFVTWLVAPSKRG